MSSISARKSEEKTDFILNVEGMKQVLLKKKRKKKRCIKLFIFNREKSRFSSRAQEFQY